MLEGVQGHFLADSTNPAVAAGFLKVARDILDLKREMTWKSQPRIFKMVS